MWIPRPRPARPDDGPACIPLLVDAGGDLLAWSVGDGGTALSTGLIRRCWDSGTHPLGPIFTHVIEEEGSAIAAIVGGGTKRWLAAERVKGISSHGLAPPHVLAELGRRLHQQSAARPPLPADTFYISSLGVQPRHRRRGLARHLLANAISRANGLDLSMVVVEVVEDNTAAVSLYASKGFKQLANWRPEGGPKVLRLCRPTGR